jgi:hypothetical protein
MAESVFSIVRTNSEQKERELNEPEAFTDDRRIGMFHGTEGGLKCAHEK